MSTKNVICTWILVGCDIRVRVVLDERHFQIICNGWV